MTTQPVDEHADFEATLLREVPLGRVNDVEVSSDSPGFATVRVQAA